jgi:hypothetical protein
VTYPFLCDFPTRGFKALKRLCKLYFQLKKHAEVKTHFNKLLKEYTQLLMENEKAINNLLEFLAGSPDIKHLYDITLKQLEKNGNKVRAPFHHHEFQIVISIRNLVESHRSHLLGPHTSYTALRSIFGLEYRHFFGELSYDMIF